MRRTVLACLMVLACGLGTLALTPLTFRLGRAWAAYAREAWRSDEGDSRRQLRQAAGALRR